MRQKIFFFPLEREEVAQKVRGKAELGQEVGWLLGSGVGTNYCQLLGIAARMSQPCLLSALGFPDSGSQEMV